MNAVRFALVLALGTSSLLSCANGDGRGFGTVDGTIRVTFDGKDFRTASGAAGRITSVNVTLAGLDLAATSAVDGGVEDRVAAFGLGATFGPLAGDYALPFGPYEVGLADYSTLAVHVARLELEGEADGDAFTIVAEPEGGITLSAAAPLPVDGNRPPIITLTIAVALGPSLLEGLDVTKAGVEALVTTRAASLGKLDASWARRGD
jgi:hypothetical protein